MIRDIAIALSFGLSLAAFIGAGLVVYVRKHEKVPAEVHLVCKPLTHKTLVCVQMEQI